MHFISDQVAKRITIIVILMEEDQKGRNIDSAGTSLQPEEGKEVEKKVKDQRDERAKSCQ